MSPLNCPIDEYKRIMMEFTSSVDLLSMHFGRTFWLDDEGCFVQHQLVRMEKLIGKDGIMYPIGIWKE